MTAPLDADTHAALVSVGRELGILLSRHAETDALARSLAPDGSGPGVRYHNYDGSLGSVRRRTAYQAEFAEFTEFLRRLDEADPGAIEFGLELLARLTPEAGVPLVERLLVRPVWTMLGMAIGRALGACESARSFELLLEHPTIPYLRDGLASNRYPDGVARAWACYRAHGDLGDPEISPRERVAALPLVGYLARFDPEHAVPELVRLTQSRNHESCVYATHQLLALGDPGAELLLDRLRETPLGTRLSFAASVAVRILLSRDPTSVVDELGGVDVLLSDGGRTRLHTLLATLLRDSFPVGGEVTKSWLARDPRFAALCAAVRTDADRELGKTAAHLLATLPKPPKSKKPRKRATPPPSPALLAELQTIGDALAQIVERLRSSGYQFLDPDRALRPPNPEGARAIAQLEASVGPVPRALVAFWTVVGSVDLRGQHPDWPRPACLLLPGVTEQGGIWLTDPLVIVGPEQIVDDVRDNAVEGGPTEIPLGPDALGKAGYSAGVLQVYAPCETDDPPVEGGGREESLLAHLRRALAWSGMPGLESIADRPAGWRADST